MIERNYDKNLNPHTRSNFFQWSIQEKSVKPDKHTATVPSEFGGITPYGSGCSDQRPLCFSCSD